jgi:hypothetical protein
MDAETARLKPYDKVMGETRGNGVIGKGCGSRVWIEGVGGVEGEVIGSQRPIGKGPDHPSGLRTPHSPASISVGSWPGVADMVVQYADLEREAAAAKSNRQQQVAPDSEVGKVLRLVIKAADNEQRAGGCWVVVGWCAPIAGVHAQTAILVYLCHVVPALLRPPLSLVHLAG